MAAHATTKSEIWISSALVMADPVRNVRRNEEPERNPEQAHGAADDRGGADGAVDAR
jgi:hypothetical protein